MNVQQQCMVFLRTIYDMNICKTLTYATALALNIIENRHIVFYIGATCFNLVEYGCYRTNYKFIALQLQLRDVGWHVIEFDFGFYTLSVYVSNNVQHIVINVFEVNSQKVVYI